MSIKMEVLLWCKPSPPERAALVRAGSWLASWTRQKPTLVGFFCGHKLLTIIVRYAPILGKHLQPRLACFQLLV